MQYADDLPEGHAGTPALHMLKLMVPDETKATDREQIPICDVSVAFPHAEMKEYQDTVSA